MSFTNLRDLERRVQELHLQQQQQDGGGGGGEGSGPASGRASGQASPFLSSSSTHDSPLSAAAAASGGFPRRSSSLDLDLLPPPSSSGGPSSASVSIPPSRGSASGFRTSTNTSVAPSVSSSYDAHLMAAAKPKASDIADPIGGFRVNYIRRKAEREAMRRRLQRGEELPAANATTEQQLWKGKRRRLFDQLYTFEYFGGDDWSEDSDDEEEQQRKQLEEEEDEVEAEEEAMEEGEEEEEEEDEIGFGAGSGERTPEEGEVGLEQWSGEKTSLLTGALVSPKQRKKRRSKRKGTGGRKSLVGLGEEQDEKRKKEEREEWNAEGKELARRQTGTVSTAKTFLIIMKSFVATGVLFLPQAFSSGGILFSSLTLAAVAAIALLAMIMLVKCRQAVAGSYGIIGRKAYGPLAYHSVRISLILSQMGFCCAYFIFNAQIMTVLLESLTDCSKVVSKYFIIQTLIALQIVVYIPLAWVRRIRYFSIPSLFADVFIIFGLGYVFYYDIHLLATHEAAEYAPLFNTSKFALFLGTSVYTFEGIGLILPIEESMRHKHHFIPLLSFSILLIALIFIAFGALTFYVFGESIEVIALLNLPPKNPIVITIFFLYIIAVVFTWPLMLFPATRIMENRLFHHVKLPKYRNRDKYGAINNAEYPVSDEPLNKPPSLARKWKKNGFRTCLVILMAGVSMAGANQFDHFISLIGSICCVPLAFIFPAMFHFKLIARPQRRKLWLAIDITMIVFGIIVMIGSTIVTVYSWATANETEDISICKTHQE